MTISWQWLGGRHANASCIRPVIAQVRTFVERFVPLCVIHEVTLWPVVPPEVKRVVRQVSAMSEEKERQRRWNEITVHQDPPMFSLLRHPHL